ncbi:zinc finger protein 391-like isoform X1 [Acipenser ruthenus]|uniref:zinc finger protein 391-like isoform X1 n=1 Tax=Acipenser ruthenus TaxID=7906 RepID=UPI0027416B8A|nr:zinc finger protein 391-like isoform X1 [Acipenser ruthenus]
MDVSVSVSFFKNELGPAIELAVQAAVETVLCEITKVVGTKLAGLQVEIAETLNENQTLKRRLKRTETELKSVREREKTSRAKTTSSKRHAPHFTEQLGVPSWTNNNNPAFVPHPKDRGLNVDEPCVSFLGDQVTEAGTEYNAASFAHCLPILINRDCGTLADPETSHLIIQEDGTDRSVSIRDDAFPRIDDIWGGGGATGRGIEEDQDYQRSQEHCVPNEGLDPLHIKEELSDIRSVLIGDEGTHPACVTDPASELDPVPVKQEDPEQDCVEIKEDLNRSSASLPCPNNYAGLVNQFSIETEKAAAFKKPRGSAKWQQPRKIGKTHSLSQSVASPSFPAFRKQHQHISVSERAYDSPQSLSLFENLRQHQRVLTGEKPYHMPDRGKRFKEEVQLRQHQRIPTGESRHPCNVCGKSFTRIKTLHIHQRIHTGEKPYPCTHCGTSFRHLDSLKKHQRIHTGEKPYKCTECGNIYRHLTSLKHHQRIHAGQRS